MSNRVPTLVAILLLSAGCAPHLPPTTVPALADPALAPFQKALQDYVNLTQPLRKEAAEAAEQVPGKADAAVGAETSVRARQFSLADALKQVRAAAKQGDLLDSVAAATIRKSIATAFAGPRRDLIYDALAEQNDQGQAQAQPVAINENVNAPRLPPQLLDTLPQLPKQLEYDFIGRTLVLRDADADIVADFLPEALPVQPPPALPKLAAPRAAGAPVPPLPLPGIRGSTVFAMIGDGGSGDMPQQQVATAMLAYFMDARRFPFVLMLGDNLYDDDYDGQFSEPYKPLLDRGVKFYAALGNHDRDLQIHFKPFNMQDRDYYSFDEGNVRFAALNSNHPSDPDQAKWLEGVFADAGNKWRICFFHHPLYSSGQHAEESRDVIRPAMEPMLVKNKVEVVFVGHEHLYERISPQKGIRYFVSGGGGRNLYNVHRNTFDEVAFSQHHFMVAEIAGDQLFFEAVTPTLRLLDCGVIFKTPEAEAKANDDTRKWLGSCNTALGPKP